MKIFDLLFAISFEFLGEITSVQCISSGEWEVVSRKTRESATGRFQIFATSGNICNQWKYQPLAGFKYLQLVEKPQN